MKDVFCIDLLLNIIQFRKNYALFYNLSFKVYGDVVNFKLSKAIIRRNYQITTNKDTVPCMIRMVNRRVYILETHCESIVKD